MLLPVCTVHLLFGNYGYNKYFQIQKAEKSRFIRIQSYFLHRCGNVRYGSANGDDLKIRRERRSISANRQYGNRHRCMRRLGYYCVLYDIKKYMQY